MLFDLPHVIAGAGLPLEEAGVAGRCTYVGGNFFAAVPAGDAYPLGNIVHDWQDADAERILANCRAAMNEGGRVLLGEVVLPDGARAHPAKLLDLEMPVTGFGRQRTDAGPAYNAAQQGYNDGGSAPYELRSRERIARFSDGLELVEPGPVPLPHWRPEPPSPAAEGAQLVELCGVARKP